MKKIYYSFFLFTGLLSVLRLSAQNCDPSTPSFTANLTGNPTGTWYSPSVSRAGYCCSASGADVCIQFNITLDPAATGISFNIASGAVPPGALYYQINCGPPVMVGSPICLNGPGPHILTFCKPGNNPNSFSITSLGPPYLEATISNTVSPQCTAILQAFGVDAPTVTWTSVPYNAQYNSFLSCLSGCDSVEVTPFGTFPPYIDYMACGHKLDGCDTANVCDTVRVYFNTDVTVNVSPPTLTLCNGSGPVTLTATASGGSGNYSFLWSNGQTTQNIIAGVGTYTVTVTDTAVCSPAVGQSVIQMLPPIIANAGTDILVCAGQGIINLNGNIQTATASQWSGGSGTYIPDNSTLNATYTPTAMEIANGFVNLILNTTANQGCPGDDDSVHITIVQPPSTTISGNTISCVTSATSYSAPVIPGCSYAWSVSGGTITGSTTSNSVNVTWGTGGSGTVSLTLTNSSGCITTITQNVSLVVLPNPAISGNNIPCQFSTGAYSVNSNPGSTYTWTVNNGTILSGDGTPDVQVNWNTFGSGTITVTETNSYGCSQTTTFPVTVMQPPVASLTGNSTGCFSTLTADYTAPAQSNVTYSWTVNGGVINGSTTSNTANITWGSSGTGTVTVTVTSNTGCTATATQSVSLGLIPTPVISGSATNCQFSNGTYSVNTTPGSMYSWTINNGTILSGNGTPSIQTSWNTYGSGSVTVTETNSFGCSQTTTFPVTIMQPPVASLSGDTAGCLSTLTVDYFATAQSNVNYLWTVNGGVINGSTTNNTANITWGSSGTGTVTVTVTSNTGCTATATQTVSLGLIPNPVISGSATNCQFTNGAYSVNLTPGSTYAWTINNGTILSGNGTPSIQATWNTYGSGSVTVTETNSFGCTQTTTFPVTVMQLPVATLTGDTSGCQSTLTALYTAPAQNFVTYSWSISGGTINGSSSTNTANVTWGSSGSGTITVTVTSINGCVATATQNVSIGLIPDPVISGSNAICQFNSGTYSVNNTPGSTYSWTVSNGTLSSSNTLPDVQVAWNAYGSGTVTVTETNSFGCTQTTSYPVTVNPQPSATLLGDTSGCFSSLTSVYSVPSQSNVTYSWTVNGGTINGPSNLNTANITWAGAGNITVTVTGLSGCTASSTQTVSIGLIPDPVISGNNTYCQFNTGSFSVIANPGSTYAWSVNNGTMASANGISSMQVNWNTFGSGLVTVTETNSYGCSQSVTFPVTVNQQPVAAIYGDTSGCLGSLTTLYTAPSQTNATYSWSVIGGTINGTPVSNSANITWDGGAGQILLTVTGASGCTATAIQNISIGLLPNPVVTGSQTSCQFLSQIYSLSPTPGSIYTWSATNGTIAGGNGTSSAQVNWGMFGNGTVTVQETNSYGCTQSGNFSVTVFQRPSPYIAGNAWACTGNAPATYTTGVQNDCTYNWTVNGGSVVSGIGSTAVQVTWSTMGTNSIILTVTNSSGCDSTVSFPVNIGMVAPASVQSSGMNGCPPLTLSISGNTPVSGQTYSWSFGDNSTSTTENPVHIYSEPGIYQVQVITTQNSGCADTAEAMVQVYEEPNAAFHHNFEFSSYVIGESELELSNQSTGATNYSWAFGNGESSTAFEPEYIFVNPGEYDIILYSVNSFGCTDTALRRIVVRNRESIYVPNAFTPNGDRANDYFSMLSINIAKAHVEIFNRWGKLFYTSDDVDFKWDGTYFGKPVELGVYCYRILAEGDEGKQYTLIGTVTVVR